MGRRLKVVPEVQNDGISILCACHRRIEESLEVLAVLLELPTEKPLSPSYKNAMQRVIDCFSNEMICHHDDEEKSLFPRVSASTIPQLSNAREILSRLIEEHKQADIEHAQANTLMAKWMSAGTLSPADRAELVRLHQSLKDMYTRHIHDEAICVFRVAADLLDQHELAAMGQEMLARRK